jgi:hypothetical protein
MSNKSNRFFTGDGIPFRLRRISNSDCVRHGRGGNAAGAGVKEWEGLNMRGFAARYLEVDLGSREICERELEEEVFRKYIGGTG